MLTWWYRRHADKVVGLGEEVDLHAGVWGSLALRHADRHQPEGQQHVRQLLSRQNRQGLTLSVVFHGIRPKSWKVMDRVTTCLETWKCQEFDSCQWNVRDFTKSEGNVREKILSGKSGLKLFIVSFIFASVLDFAELVHFILVSGHVLLHSYSATDNNTSTGMIWVTLNMGWSAANRQENVRELHIVWRVLILRGRS